MTLEKFASAKHLFLIFPGGCGGNHLANMLSMDPIFAPRYKINPNRYASNMIKDYFTRFSPSTLHHGHAVAHFSALENLQPRLLEKETQHILDSKGIYIFCSHAYEFIIRERANQLVSFNDRIFCLWSVPTGKNKLVKSRMDNGPWRKGEDVNQIVDGGTKIEDLYDPKTFCKVNSISMDQVVLLDTDIFYSIEGYDYLHDLIYENFRITLNPFCRELHTLYINYAEAGYAVDNKLEA
jgi:hypothetical protein